MSRIEEIRVRLNAATSGPWEIGCLLVKDADISFIANAPEDVAYLLSELDRLTAENATKDAEIAALKDNLKDQTARANIACRNREVIQQDRDRLWDENKALKEANRWKEGAPPDFGEQDRVWIIAEIPSLYRADVFSYQAFVWNKGGGWSDKAILRTRRWMLMPLPDKPEGVERDGL